MSLSATTQYSFSQTTKALLDSFSANTENYYLFIGGASFLPPADTPDVPAVQEADIKLTKFKMICAKRINGSMVRMAIPRVNWTSGATYYFYDEYSTTGGYANKTGHKKYVVNSANNVYLCVGGNTATLKVSTVEPTVTSGVFQETADGIRWKYLFHLTADDYRFMSDEWIGVPLNQYTDCSVTPGTVSAIDVLNSGRDYSVGNHALTITDNTGRGTGAAAYATADAFGNITNAITITNHGSGYSNAVITLTTPTGANATFKAHVSPINGHGFEPWKDLMAQHIFVAARVGQGDATEANTWPVQVGFRFRTFGIVKDPFVFGSTTERINDDTITFYYSINITAMTGSDFISGENVSQTDSSGEVVFSGVVADVVNSVVRVVETIGTPVAQQTLSGTHANSTRIVSYTTPSAALGTGDVIYIENVYPTTRSLSQSEVFRFVYGFTSSGGA